MAFVVLIDQPVGSGKNRKSRVIAMSDEDSEICQYETAEEARAAVKGHFWEHTWAWYVVELAEGSTVEGG